MSTPVDVHSWSEANQRYLMAALGMVRATLEKHRLRAEGKETVTDSTAEAALEAAAKALPSPSALDRLCSIFGLSGFERGVLLLCAGVELESSFATACGAAQGDPRRTTPTFSLALAALGEPHWSALAPGAPLRRWRLIELKGNDSLVSGALRIDERILHYLTGINELDGRLAGLITTVSGAPEVPESQMEVVRRMDRLWHSNEGNAPLVVLCGAEPAAREAVAAMACRGLGLRLHAIRSGEIPANASDRESLSRLWEREAVLSQTALLIDADGAEAGECARTLVPFLDGTAGIMVVSRSEPMMIGVRRTVVRIDVPKPSALEQRETWHRALGELASAFNGSVNEVVTQFNLPARGIQAACMELRAERATGSPPAGESLWEACRSQARPRLDDLAQRIEPAATWQDLVLPEAQLTTLHEIAAHVRQRATVYWEWGFGAKSARGLGISALFCGSSGTGKTMAAEVLAGELNLDLYRIDLSQVVSKYIGETEKNLRRVFDAAEEGGAILLFDEADALFGKRSEVKDSHDRYANIEVSYLLQRMEAYRGLAILTTNLKSALDTGFQRRLRFVVQFPFPDAAARALIWQHIFPANTPKENLDIQRLARLNIAGGNIRNIALNAAFLAADAKEAVGMEHLLRAARTEYAKFEKPLTESEIGGWRTE